MNKFFLIAIFLILFFIPLNGQIRINEIMQSNIDVLIDDLQEFPDSWMELYNHSEETVNIQGWYISTEEDYREGWKIEESIAIAPQAYLIIYCDKVASGLHTHFRIDSGKGSSLYLFDENGLLIDRLRNIPKQPAPNISWGRLTNPESWGYYIVPTPNAANQGKTSDTVLGEVFFSIEGGIFSSPITLSLSLPADCPSGINLSDIHYTLDGSEPTLSSPEYESPIGINATTIVRAKIIHLDYLSRYSQAQSYIFESREITLPVVSLVTDDRYMYDDEFGIYVEGNGEYGILGQCFDRPANWNNDWRRPVNIEYFHNPYGKSVINQLGEMRIGGGCSRANPQKTLFLYANKRFGEHNRFGYDIFPAKGKLDLKSVMLRNSGNDFWKTHFRDAVIQLFMGRKVDVDYQEYQPAIIYINGVYYGIKNIRERSNDQFIFSNYGYEDNEIDMISNWITVENGDKNAFDYLIGGIREGKIDYEEIEELVDIDEYINYMILEIYVANSDFPENNINMWKPKNEGKWRFILKDLDRSMGYWNLPEHNTLLYNIEEDPIFGGKRHLFKACLRSEKFAKEFYSRFAVYMGDILNEKATVAAIDSLYHLIEDEYPYHIERWKDKMEGEYTMNIWYHYANNLKTWAQQRNDYVYTHLEEYFGLGEAIPLIIDNTFCQKQIQLSLNSLPLFGDRFSGRYFQGETIRLSLKENTPSAKWELSTTVDGVKTTSYHSLQELSYYIPEDCTDIRIRLIDSTSIDQLPDPAFTFWVKDGTLTLNNLDMNSNISLFDINGRAIYEQSTSATTLTLSLFHLKKGVYILKVSDPTGSYCRKVFIASR